MSRLCGTAPHCSTAAWPPWEGKAWGDVDQASLRTGPGASGEVRSAPARPLQPWAEEWAAIAAQTRRARRTVFWGAVLGDGGPYLCLLPEGWKVRPPIDDIMIVIVLILKVVAFIISVHIAAVVEMT